MPLQRCNVRGRRGWRWGDSGKCYVGNGAKQKAIKQGIAIEGSSKVQATLTGNKRTEVKPSNTLKADPTRTKTLRRQFETELRKRFNRVKRKIMKVVVEQDAFGLRTTPSRSITGNALDLEQIILNYNPGQPRDSRDEPVDNTRWQFHTDRVKVQKFLLWLTGQINADILLGGQATDDDYWERYVHQGYLKGAGRAFDDTRAAAKAMISEASQEQLAFYEGSKAEFLRDSFGRPESVEKVKLLASRTYTDLKNVTDTMATRMSRTLVDGLVQGQNPRVIGRNLAKEIDQFGKRRAETIARTEVIRAHAEGQLDSLERLGMDEVGVMVEWSTAGDNRVCPLCRPLDDTVLKTKEAHGLLPRHPNCRCAFIPANVGESPKSQKRKQSQVKSAIEESVEREGGEAKTTWMGPDKKIDKSRPEKFEVN